MNDPDETSSVLARRPITSTPVITSRLRRTDRPVVRLLIGVPPRSAGTSNDTRSSPASTFQCVRTRLMTVPSCGITTGWPNAVTTCPVIAARGTGGLPVA